jgi:predicted nucleic acid-binding protein
MTAQCFVDTNILVYVARARNDEKRKFAVANEIIQRERFCISAQVLQEFYVAVQKTALGKAAATPLSEPKAAEWVGWLEPFCEVATDSFLVLRAIETARRYKISYWDAAIIAAAERASASIIYSEDLNHGQHYGDVQVLNPFRPR